MVRDSISGILELLCPKVVAKFLEDSNGRPMCVETPQLPVISVTAEAPWLGFHKVLRCGKLGT